MTALQNSFKLKTHQNKDIEQFVKEKTHTLKNTATPMRRYNLLPEQQYRMSEWAVLKKLKWQAAYQPHYYQTLMVVYQYVLLKSYI